MVILYITRHGETEYNRLGLFIGQKDIDINENGIAQAHELGKKVKSLNIDFILSSSLSRARQTAEIVNDYIHRDIRTDKRLIERNVGAYEGLTMQELREKFQKGYSDDIVKVYNEVPPGGESAGDVQKRVFAALEELKINYPDKKILIITHSFITKIINKYFNPNISAKEFFDFHLNNTDIKKFEL